MSRFIPVADMSFDQIMQCGYDAMAIVTLCELAALEGSGKFGGSLSGNMAMALKLAGELIAIVHDTVEDHEKLIREARS